MLSDPEVASLVGCRLGVYQVVTPLGAGGMGEVYRARDTRLGRDVALKVLPREFTADPDRLARFEREARALAALNHPHIAAIYGIEDIEPPADSGLQGTVRTLALELVEGDTLAQRIQQSAERRRSGGLSVDDALAIARQIADALDVAHEKGIVHRDLKPSNIMIRPDGVVKVLDFGLAKLTPAVASAEPASTSAPTFTAEATRDGLIVGTAAYMSPEQARGQVVDKRTDIWAFGCVLYEMLAGRAAFARATPTDTLAAILEREPDWSALPPDLPAILRRLLNRCLQKDSRHRMRDMGDVRIGLEEVVAVPVVTGTKEADRARGRRRLAIGIALVAVIGAAALTWLLTRLRDSGPATASERVIRLEMSLDSVGPELPMPSPDGRHLAFVRATGPDRRLLWIHSLDSGESRSLPGTEGAMDQIWSPDGRWIAFFADGKLKKVSPSGGPPQTVTTVAGFQDAAWGARGDIIFRPANRQGLLRVHESGGTPSELTTLDRSLTENSHRGPFFLPDGRRFLFTNRCEQREHNALFLGSLDSGRTQRVLPLQSNAAYLPPRGGSAGALLYYRDGGLFAQRFDTEHVVLLGEPVPVLEHVGYRAASVLAQFEASLDGSLIVSRPAGDDNLLTWFNRKGEATGTVGGPDSYHQPRISPNGALIAFNRADPQNGNRDIWYTEISRGITARLTTDAANDWFPAWSPNGKQMVFTSDRAGAKSGAGGYLFIKKSMDPGRDELPLPTEAESGAYDWSRDGKWISFGGQDIWIASVSGDSKPFAFLATSFHEGGGRFSPDGKWIAYVSDETGRVEVYVRRFSGAPATEGRLQVSKSGGEDPVWRSDGQELFYVSGNQNDVGVYAARTSDLNRTGGVSVPELLFRACPQTTVAGPMDGTPWEYVYDTDDGKRFLINCRAQPQDRFGVLLNWTMPADR